MQQLPLQANIHMHLPKIFVWTDFLHTITKKLFMQSDFPISSKKNYWYECGYIWQSTQCS